MNETLPHRRTAAPRVPPRPWPPFASRARSETAAQCGPGKSQRTPHRRLGCVSM
jgi:hypothetical protein